MLTEIFHLLIVNICLQAVGYLKKSGQPCTSEALQSAAHLLQRVRASTAQNTHSNPEGDVSQHMQSPPNSALANPVFLPSIPLFPPGMGKMPGCHSEWETTEKPETLDGMKAGLCRPQQVGVLENTTFVKPERENNTEAGMGNEICMYLGPHPALSRHCTSQLCIQGALDLIQKRCRGTNVALATPPRAGRNKEDPRAEFVSIFNPYLYPSPPCMERGFSAV